MPDEGPPAPGRGRRRAGSGTREAIVEAARRQFAEVGYPRTTLRAVAREAGVDVRLVTHYFNTKQELFFHSVQLPFDPEQMIDAVLGGGVEGVGERYVRFVLGVLDSEEGRRTMLGLIRAAASEAEAAEMVRRFLQERLLTPAVRRIGGDRAELRAALMGSQIAGLAFTRHVVGLPALAQAPTETLVAALAPVLQHYLVDPLP